MPVIPSKFGIGAVEGGVAVSLGFLDPVESANVSLFSGQEHFPIDIGSQDPCEKAEERVVYPFL